jgi:molybdate transport system substrate-binding protein
VWRVISLLLVGCGAADAPKVELHVFAASSLTESFQEVAEAFEALNPEVDVRVSLAGSQVLRLQIEQGAAADVFASADEAHLNALVERGLVAQGQLFARNELVVIVPNEPPSTIRSFEDLARAGRLVVGAENVPVGRYTRELLDKAGQQLGAGFVEQVRAQVVSEEGNVRLARAKVELGEADAAIVYRTDAVASDRVRVVDIPGAFQVPTAYVIGPVLRSPNRAQADRFVAFVRSDAGRRLLDRHGFATGGL